MIEILLNYTLLGNAKDKYDTFKGMFADWFQTHKDKVSSVDASNEGNWRTTFDTQMSDVLDKFEGLQLQNDSMLSIFDETEDMSGRLINRCFDFADVIKGQDPLEEYPTTPEQGANVNLYYNNVFYRFITINCDAVTEDTKSEYGEIDAIESLCEGLKYLSTGVLGSELSAIRTDIKPQEYIDPFKNSFELYVTGVQTLNDTVSADYATITSEVNKTAPIERTYDFSGITGLSEKQEAEIWFATYVSDDSKAEYINDIEYDQYILEIYRVYQNAPADTKALFDQYRGKIIIAKFNAYGNENPDAIVSYHSQGKLYINSYKDINDAREDGLTFYHETGHFIVYSTGALDSAEMRSFRECLNTEIQAYVKSVEDQARADLKNDPKASSDPKKLEKQVEELTQKRLKAQFGDNTFDGVSDMIDAATDGKYKPNYGHTGNNKNYWKENDTRQVNEAFAEMFSAEMTGDTTEIDWIKQNCPQTYAAYEATKQYMYDYGEVHG